jgi:hypothetical protein
MTMSCWIKGCYWSLDLRATKLVEYFIEEGDASNDTLGYQISDVYTKK